jgi:hypothetical protein
MKNKRKMKKKKKERIQEKESRSESITCWRPPRGHTPQHVGKQSRVFWNPILVSFPLFNKLPEAECFIRKTGLFISQFWIMKV